MYPIVTAPVPTEAVIGGLADVRLAFNRSGEPPGPQGRNG
jgi:hypothetical protein